MSKTIKQNILTGVMITLISALIIGGLTLTTDYYVTKAKQELVNKTTKEDKTQLNRLYRVTIKRISVIEKNIQRMDRVNVQQHEELNTSIKSLTYAVTKNNTEMRKSLREIKNANIFSYAYTPYQPDSSLN